MKNAGSLLTLVLAMLGAASAGAQEAPAKEKTAAREIVIEGDRLLEVGDASGALQSYTAAYHLVHAPTVGLRIAKAQAALGRLRQALASAEEAARLPVEPGEHAAFAEARSKAAELAAELIERIPVLELVVTPSVPGTEIQIDGGVLPKGSHWRLDPGPHRVRVNAPEHQVALREITLAERARERLEIVLVPLDAQRPPLAGVSSQSAKPPEQAPGDTTPIDSGTEEQRASAARTRGYVALTIAAVGIVSGSVTGALAFKTKPDCDPCSREFEDDLDKSLLYGNIANVSFGVAAAAGIYGLYELIANGSVETPRAASLLPRVTVSAQPGRDLGLKISGSF